MSDHILELFHPYTAGWFQRTLGAPTKVQEEAWPSIAAGNHTLVSAPTGTGKTLSAFLVFIDGLMARSREGSLGQELQLIYVSPLKSLAGDIRENLRRPLEGILEEESRDGAASYKTEITVAIRTGDTTQKERNRMIKVPPHILITTPESLYLMLTSKSGQKILHTANAIIIDELHALIDSKRGAHLMLSIARLDKLCGQPLQRIGLSATIEPLSTAAMYLSPDPVTVVAPKMHKEIKLAITSPFKEEQVVRKDPVWQEVARAVYSYCTNTRTAIAFVEGRAYAEKLAYYINQLGGEGFARTHHGSLSKEHRFEVENSLRNGTLRLLCATSSMELGIDVGDIDQVFQIGCPRSISSTMQRLGRAGHNPNRTSVMYLFPREAVEGLYCGMTAEVARKGGIEYSHPPRLCFDVLSQHLVSMACGEGYETREVLELLKRAYPFREVTLEDVRDILCMLAGDYEHQRDIPVRPRIIYDRINDQVLGDAYSRMLAVSAGGTIPDRGLYSARTESGVKLGELDEEFVFETRVGDRFLLGTFAWQIMSIQKDTVIVTQTSTAGARLPFWHGDMKGRRLRTGLAFGAILRQLAVSEEAGSMLLELKQLGLDDISAKNASDFLKRQLISTGVLPDDRTLIVEHFKDETGNYQMMVHSVLGRQVNEPLVLLTKFAAQKHTDTTINCVSDDDGFLLFPYDGNPLPEGLLKELSPESARSILEAMLPSIPLFNMNFRYNCGRALLSGVRSNKRQPLWVQRMRSAELLSSLVRQEKHPIIRETKRECLEDYWDLTGVETIINGIRSGNIQLLEIYSETPSPMSLPLRRQTEASMMYDYSPTPVNLHQATMEALKDAEATMITPDQAQLELIQRRTKLPEDEQQLHTLLMVEGDMIAGELEIPVEWLERLARANRVKYIEPGLWIATEQDSDYTAAFIDRNPELSKRIVLRHLRYKGAKTADQIEERYYLTTEEVESILSSLCEEGKIIEQEGLYYHSELYDRARTATIKDRRRQIRTLPPERYASLLTSRLKVTALAEEQLEKAFTPLLDQEYPAAYLENILLPARVGNYRPELLDALLAKGTLFWQLHPQGTISFHRSEDIDWEADLTEVLNSLDGPEKLVYETLLKRGATFGQRLGSLIEGSPYDTLLSLAEKGLICADSFLPVRQWLTKDKLLKGTLRQRINARTKLLAAGRWEVIRPLLPLTTEEVLERNFDRAVILCRETIQGISWGTALETLRIWEFTGKVRRGYFIEGMSGVQFIRDKDFAGTMLQLEQPEEQIHWLNGVDPIQLWGKCISHKQDRAFLNIPGTAVALYQGSPIMIMERNGKLLRIPDRKHESEALRTFVHAYAKRSIYGTLNRVAIKEYPKESSKALREAGFLHELQDYVLYRGYR